MASTVLEVKDLRTQIQLRSRVVRAVDGVSFSISAGETLGLVGESGSGKSMIANSIMRLLPAGGKVVSGSVRLDDQELLTMDDDRLRSVRGNQMGMIFQDPMTSLNPTMTIGRQIGESVILHRGVGKERARERTAEVLGLVGMPNPLERLDDYPHQLSGGLRQRVMIAMALACEPRLLIADEPTTALDVTIQDQILELLDSLKRDLGMAILLITHDMGVVAGHVDRTVVLYAGQIVETAKTVELFEDVHHPYTEALLAAIPQLDQDKTQRLYAVPGLPPDLSRPLVACRFNPRCRYATEVCRLEEPPLAGNDPDHPFACFHPVARRVEDIAGAGEKVAEAGHAAAVEVLEPEVLVPGAAQPVAVAAGPAAGVVMVGPPQDITGRAAPGEGDGRPSMLKLEGVYKQYPVTAGAVLQRRVGWVQAVRGVNLELTSGETLGVVGESGCGKSTLGRMVVGLERPTEGRVIFEGRDLSRLRGAAERQSHRELQLMFQDPYSSLDPRMRVGPIIREPLVIQHLGSTNEQRAWVKELLSEVGLPPHAVDLYPHEFSGGQRQRIGLARALALRPKLIVADEPVSALDVSIRSQILNLMKRLQIDHGLTYIFISHDLSVVRYLADRIAVMYLGKLVEIGTGDDIYARAAHPYTAGLIASIPVPKPTVQRNRRREPIRGELPSPLHPPSGCPFRTRCPRAQELCAQVEPPLSRFGGEHLAACHFPLQARAPEAAALAVPAPT